MFNYGIVDFVDESQVIKSLVRTGILFQKNLYIPYTAADFVN